MAREAGFGPDVEMTEEMTGWLELQIRNHAPRAGIIEKLGCSRAWLIQYTKDFWLMQAQASAAKVTDIMGHILPPMPDTPRNFTYQERANLINKAFERAEALLEGLFMPRDFQQWTVAVGILIDKKRLEDGEATSRPDTSGNEARDAISRRIDELARRKREDGNPRGALG